MKTEAGWKRAGCRLLIPVLLFTAAAPGRVWGEGAASAAAAPISGGATEKDEGKASPQATLDPSALRELREAAPAAQNLIADALDLTKKKLVYKYGSDDPAEGGMDCSGTIHYLLQKEGVSDVPRQASDIYAWVRRKGLFQAVVSTNPSTFELDALRPGDLLFWTGTYDVDRDPPVTHVMIYLGTIPGQNGKPKRVMVGASDGRYYAGAARHGVSVFDFDLPGSPPPARYTNGTARFIGYAPVPGLRKAAPASAPLPPPPLPQPDEAPVPAPAMTPPPATVPVPETPSTAPSDPTETAAPRPQT
ncbi:MAG TPA: NlpC/P60 family protein [Candidatus Methylacidiphilales bacterium]